MALLRTGVQVSPAPPLKSKLTPIYWKKYVTISGGVFYEDSKRKKLQIAQIAREHIEEGIPLSELVKNITIIYQMLNMLKKVMAI